MSLDEADDAVRNASAVSLVKNVLVTHQFADNLKLLIGISISGQKACVKLAWGVNTERISPEKPSCCLISLRF